MTSSHHFLLTPKHLHYLSCLSLLNSFLRSGTSSLLGAKPSSYQKCQDISLLLWIIILLISKRLGRKFATLQWLNRLTERQRWSLLTRWKLQKRRKLVLKNSKQLLGKHFRRLKYKIETLLRWIVVNIWWRHLSNPPSTVMNKYFLLLSLRYLLRCRLKRKVF